MTEQQSVTPVLAQLRPIRPLSEVEFTRFQRLIELEVGIHLTPAKKALLIGRLSSRIRELSLPSFTAYFERVAGGDREERVRMIDAICTNETHFFREPKQFDYLERVVIPQWKAQAAAGRRDRLVRVWSAGCSTGEEPYSIAMMLHTLLPAEDGWNIQVVGTDISTKVLRRAEEGVWPIARAEEIPKHYLKAYMLRGSGSQQGKMKATPTLRPLIRFKRLNLIQGEYQIDGPFDLVFCRNVLIYFNAEHKRRVIEGLIRQLKPDGLLFLGHSETLNGLSEQLKSVGPTVYGRPRT